MTLLSSVFIQGYLNSKDNKLVNWKQPLIVALEKDAYPLSFSIVDVVFRCRSSFSSAIWRPYWQERLVFELPNHVY